VSGCTSWQNGRWLIVLNGAEPLVRQGFSFAHEFKHAVDHRFRHEFYFDRPGLSATTRRNMPPTILPRACSYRSAGCTAPGQQAANGSAISASCSPSRRRL
jgi:hypothetical protein